MTLSDFQERVDRHGADLARWSPEDVAPARALLGQSERARQLLREADELSALFKASSQVKAPSGLADRILARLSDDDVQSENAFRDDRCVSPNTSDTNDRSTRTASEASSVSDNFPQKRVARS
ncbi:hypothetical protein [uncultured Roseibium sp.]|uniref:hypothetical protein n=1 Tax=uncultured Roseibium sp. TaxID=1936171 RepID=UPI003217518E